MLSSPLPKDVSHHPLNNQNQTKKWRNPKHNRLFDKDLSKKGFIFLSHVGGDLERDAPNRVNLGWAAPNLRSCVLSKELEG